MRIRPYRTTQNVVDGVVITFEDITEVENSILANAELLRLVNERREVEGRLRVSEEKYRAMVEHSVDLIMRYDREGRHIFANHAAVKFMGSTVEDCTSSTPREMGLPEHQTSQRGAGAESQLIEITGGAASGACV